MKSNNPIPGMYLRIAGAEPVSAEEERPRARLWPATAVLMSALFATAMACGAASDDAALRTGTRANRVEAVDCAGGDGVLGSDDDSCTATGGTSGSGVASDSSGDSDSSGGATLTTADATGDTSTGAAPPPPPPAPDAGEPPFIGARAVDQRIAV